MRLFAALLPPAPVLEELARVVRDVLPGTPELDPVPPQLMHMPITPFGNVARTDAPALLSAIAREARHWPTAEVQFAGAAALEWPGDRSVWSTLTGDVDALGTIGRGVPQVVQRLGFFTDRRRFRPWLAVGSITDETTAPYLERLVAALDVFRSASFTVEEVSVLRRLPLQEGASDGAYEVYENLPLKRS